MMEQLCCPPFENINESKTKFPLILNYERLWVNWVPGLALKQLRILLAATKQLNEWFSPSVCPSVRPSVRLSHLLNYVPIIVS